MSRRIYGITALRRSPLVGSRIDNGKTSQSTATTLGSSATRTREYQRSADVFRHVPNDLELTCKQILKDRLDILIFLDLGMSPLSTKLGGLRLAPIQATTWAHPVTSGLPTMDYFISNELMEAPRPSGHYTEEVFRLPKIGSSYIKPSLARPLMTKTRRDFGIREDAVAYLCCQSLFKYLPAHDQIFPAIASRLPQAQFVFLPPNKSLSLALSTRLQKAFKRFGLHSEDHCVLVERRHLISEYPLIPLDYLNLNQVCDVFLDTLDWSACVTAMEALACDLPVVTCPGRYFRARQSYGILQMLGMPETIADGKRAYVEIAVRLGADPEWRREVVRQLQARRDEHLYGDLESITALEDFYFRVTRHRAELEARSFLDLGH